MGTDTNNKQPKNGQLRFSIRTLFILMTVFGPLSGWYGPAAVDNLKALFSPDPMKPVPLTLQQLNIRAQNRVKFQQQQQALAALMIADLEEELIHHSALLEAILEEGRIQREAASEKYRTQLEHIQKKLYGRREEIHFKIREDGRVREAKQLLFEKFMKHRSSMIQSS